MRRTSTARLQRQPVAHQQIPGSTCFDGASDDSEVVAGRDLADLLGSGACQNQSKTHVEGQTGTPFSQCVTAMAKLASGTTTSPTVACTTLSKKHVEGQNGTPFSRCIAAGAKLLKDQ
jgi:hypothetical protein